jgi:threonyl-tRNA synthetase
MENNDKLVRARHSLAHLLAIEVLKHDPAARLAIGPWIDDGFYYDFEFSPGKTPAPEDLAKFEAGMRASIGANPAFTLAEISADEARARFAAQPYKLELIEELAAKGEKLTTYQTGDFVDLCAGPHVAAAGEIAPDSFKLDRVAGAYWRGDESSRMLTRIYGLAFATKEELDAYLAQREEAQKRDHRKLGKDLDLFVFSDVVGKGLPLWTERGATVRRELERFIVDEEIRRGYRHVMTPDIAKLDLYRKSGHYPYYQDSMYAPIKIDEEEFMLRPMTCPHHFELYLSKPRSYRELPMRIAELAKLYRYEQSGELSGLVRVRCFCLADAHIVCADSAQAAAEVSGALDLIEHVAGVFGLTLGEHYSYRLSLGDRADEKKYFKDDAAWDQAEGALREMLRARGTPFVEAAGEAAFYGPKIDVQMKSVRGKEDTAFTVQYDFVMPKRFALNHIAADGAEREGIVVHRSSIGAIERVVAFLTEHFAGAFPLWLAPMQVAVVPVKDAHLPAAEALAAQMRAAGLRPEVDAGNDSFGKKIRNAKTMKVPYVIVVGDKEAEAGQVTLEARSGAKVGPLPIAEAVAALASEVREKRLPA